MVTSAVNSVWKSVGAAALDLLLPAVCAGCGELGAACCPACLEALEANGPFPAVASAHALARYDGVARRLVLAYKERGRHDLAAPLGDALARVVPSLPRAGPDADGVWWLVPAPSRTAEARARGGQHMLRLARRCAASLAARGVPAAVAPALELDPSARDAVGLDRAQRAANLAGRLRFVRDGAPPPAAPVVLLDDVATTGATITACSAALARGGVGAVTALTLTAV